MGELNMLILDILGVIGCLKAIARADSRTISHGLFIFLLLYFVLAMLNDLAYYIDPSVLEYRQWRIASVRVLMFCAAWYGALAKPRNPTLGQQP